MRSISLIILVLCFTSCGSNGEGKTSAFKAASVDLSVMDPIDSTALTRGKQSKQTCFITNITEQEGQVFIHADYIQRIDGQRAVEEAKKRGDADTFFLDGKMQIGVPNDYYVINDNPKIRKLLLDPTVKFEFVENPDRLEGKVENNLDGLKLIYKDAQFELTIKDGIVVKVFEIFVP